MFSNFFAVTIFIQDVTEGINLVEFEESSLWSSRPKMAFLLSLIVIFSKFESDFGDTDGKGP